jgi:hypothetical protein
MPSRIDFLSQFCDMKNRARPTRSESRSDGRARLFSLAIMSYGVFGSRLETRGMASARGSGGSKCCDTLCGFADQYAVGGRSCASADTEQGIEGGMACSAPIEAEHELVKVVLEVCFPQTVVDAQAPTLEV